MSITSHGMRCDVGGEYILFDEDYADTFSVNGSGRMDVCVKHRPDLAEAGEKNDWTILPDGPLREVYAQRAEAQRQPAP